MRVRRWLAGCFIAAYCTILSYGLLCHTMGIGLGAHPFMYLIIWDMYSGWTAYTSRLHVVAEGESGKYYELVPAPWRTIRPYGSQLRHEYDPGYGHAHLFAANTLKHVQAEPMTRIFSVEETWPTKYDIPDAVWERRFGQPKVTQHYFRLRSEMSGDGTVLRLHPSFLDQQQHLALTDNPRLRTEARNQQPFFVVDQLHNADGRYTPPGVQPVAISTTASPVDR